MCQLSQNEIDTITINENITNIDITNAINFNSKLDEPAAFCKRMKCTGNCLKDKVIRKAYVINYHAWHSRNSPKPRQQPQDGVETFFGSNAALTAYLASSVSHAVEVSVGYN